MSKKNQQTRIYLEIGYKFRRGVKTAPTRQPTKNQQESTKNQTITNQLLVLFAIMKLPDLDLLLQKLGTKKCSFRHGRIILSQDWKHFIALTKRFDKK